MTATFEQRLAKALRPKRRRANPRRGRVCDEKYLAFIRELPCVVCVGFERFLRLLNGTHTWGDVAYAMEHPSYSPIEAAHSGPHGISQKADDDTALPLCCQHHRTGRDSYHVIGRRFFEHHWIDRGRLLTELRNRFGATSG